MRFMRIAALLGGVSLVACGVATAVRADFVVFKVPTTSLKFVLQGKSLTSRTLPTINFTHAASKQTFDLPQTPDTEVIVLPPLNQVANKRLLKAKGDSAALREMATWAVDHGLLLEFHRSIDQLAAIDAADPFVVEVKRLKADFAQPLPDESTEGAKSATPAGFKTAKSAHFTLDFQEADKLGEKSEVKRKKPETRLEQLEQLLELFVMKCADRRLPVQVPRSRLKVQVLPGKLDSRVTASGRTTPMDSMILWSPETNVLYIGNTNNMPAALGGLKKLLANVQKIAAQPRRRNNPGQPGGGGAGGAGRAAPGGPGGPGGMDAGGGSSGLDLTQLSLGQLTKLTAAAQALLVIGTDNLELESVSREAAYLFSVNCGVIPPSAPHWVRDGLAAYFEFPSEMGWLKFGDVGQLRNAWYQAALNDPDRFVITDIVTGRCHDNLTTSSEAMRAGNLSWALTHFLLNQHSEGLGKYLAAFRDMPPDVVLEPALLNSLFDEAFAEERSKLEEAWRSHMAGLRAEYLILQEEEGSTAPATAGN